MKKLLYSLFCLLAMGGAANAMNATADMVKNCEGVFVASSDSYVLRCTKSEKIMDLLAGDAVRQFFVANNDGDIKGTFLSKIPDDTDYVYVNVVSNLPDMRYENQTCYRFIVEKDVKRDGIYAIEVCEYERPDYYL